MANRTPSLDQTPGADRVPLGSARRASAAARRALFPTAAALLWTLGACGGGDSGPIRPGAADVATVSIRDAPDTVRQGDVSSIRVVARDAEGARLRDVSPDWSTVPSEAALVRDGRFVAFEPATVRLVARAGDATDSAEVEVTPRGLEGTITVEASRAAPDRTTTNLAVHDDVAYTGTWRESPEIGATEPGNAVFVWDVSEPTNPVLADSVLVDAGVVNDVGVSRDGELGVVAQERSEDTLNGVTLLDLGTDPLHPTVITRFTDGLEGGVHNVWLEGDYLYAVVPSARVLILDVSDPSSPEVVAGYHAGSSLPHDVSVRDGLAFVSHMDAGLAILDVGNGVAAGSPESPVEVARLDDLGGQTHNAWYWPEAGRVFVGEEDFSEPGEIHVVDVTDLRRPRKVATIAVPGDPPHFFWLDEPRATLYAAWYGAGIRAFDVSGELMGPLERQGREIASAVYGRDGACPPEAGAGTCTWAVQLHDGMLFASDVTEGLVVAAPAR